MFRFGCSSISYSPKSNQCNSGYSTCFKGNAYQQLNITKEQRNNLFEGINRHSKCNYNTNNSNTAVEQVDTTQPETLKPFESMPRVSSFQLMKQILKTNPHKPFPNWYAWEKQYGDVVRLNMLGIKFVVTYNPEHWPEIFRATGKIPGPLQLLPWLHRERQKKKNSPKYEMNLLALEGQDWRSNRTVLDQIFSTIPHLQSYLPSISMIADDLVKSMNQSLTTQNLDGKTLQNLLYSYSNEVIGQVVFGYRLGGLNSTKSELYSRFNELLLALFRTASELQFSIPIYQLFATPMFKKFDKLVNDIEAISAEYIKQADHHHQQMKEQNQNYERSDLIHHMRKAGQNEERVQINASTMFLAGSDSTTHSLSWVIYNLGRFPEVQEKLRSEVMSILPDHSSSIDKSSLHLLKYLRAVFKESLRLTPTAAGVTRVLDRSVNVGGYEVPPGVMIFMAMYVSNQKSQNFPHAAEFLPERWLTDDRKSASSSSPTGGCEHANSMLADLKKPNPFAHLPFGFGPRICQAFRLAELEAYVMLIKLVQNYRWKTLSTVEPYVDLFIHPDRDLQIQWEPLHPNPTQ